MRKLIATILLAGLSACATPETILTDGNGHYTTCGGSSVGSVAGGYIGYSIQKDMDAGCVRESAAKGYNPVLLPAPMP